MTDIITFFINTKYLVTILKLLLVFYELQMVKPTVAPLRDILV